MTKTGPVVLVTNDDGIHAEGLKYLKQAASSLGRVQVAAPETEQSVVGHAITLYDPIKVHEVTKDGEFYGYGVHGTPADSVKLALHELLPERPALVISGINNGANLGLNVLYSGTVSAATEAAIWGYRRWRSPWHRRSTPVSMGGPPCRDPGEADTGQWAARGGRLERQRPGHSPGPDTWIQAHSAGCFPVPGQLRALCRPEGEPLLLAFR